MGLIDYAIIVVYLAGMVIIGMMFEKKASAGINSFFLGDRKIPWWALGASGMAGNLDISGTMINTAWIFALGAAGMFIEIRGGVTLILAFLMIFMGKWNRRAQVMTTAEWMRFRFGAGREGDVARLMAAVSILLVTIAMITYFAIGSGKFIDEFLGIPSIWGIKSEFWAALMMIVLSVAYTVASGMYGVVWTDVVQSLLIFAMIIYVAVLAFGQALPDAFSISVPLRDGGFQALEVTRESWTNMIPTWKANFPAESMYSIYNLFGIAILFYLFKVTIEGSGGTSGYMIQRFYAARSDRDAGLLSLFWTFLLSFRWMFIAAIAVLAIGYGVNHSTIADPEMVIPKVINQSLHAGMKGFLVVGLMAAAMSTFAPTVNAGAAYWVKDIYQAYINPRASERVLLLHSRWASVVVVILGLLFSLSIKNINEIWGWLTMSIGAGMIMPTLVRWYWWRMNGWGFAIGTGVGIIAAVIQRLAFPNAPEYVSFSFASGLSLIGTIVGTLLTRPTDNEVLFNFYKTTRPFGFWGHIRKRIPSHVIGKINNENRRDIVSVILAVPWQLALFMLWMMVIMKRWDSVLILLVLLALLSVGLYFTWFRHLSKEVKVDDQII